MHATLAAWQDAFDHVLRAVDPLAGADPAARRLAAQPGFAVYRNTVLKGCIDALQANYPAVARLVGEEWFRAGAAVYSRGTLPSHATLLDYGATFAEFLSQFGPAAELQYLADVARLDRNWSEAHVAADAPRLDAAMLGSLVAEDMTRLRLALHPAARWLWCADRPAYSIWSRSRAGDDDLGDIEWRGEGALLTRPEFDVAHASLSRAGVAFLDACAGGESIQGAVLAALDVDEHADVSQLVRRLLQAGAFSALEPVDTEVSR